MSNPKEEKRKKLKIKKDFFRERHHHHCRLCGTPIRKLLPNGSMVPLGNFAHMIFELDGGGTFRFNGCKDCLRSLDTKDQDVMDIVMEEDAEGKKYINREVGGRKVYRPKRGKARIQLISEVLGS